MQSIGRYRPSSYHVSTTVPTPRNHMKINDLLSAKNSDNSSVDENFTFNNVIDNDDDIDNNNNNNDINTEIVNETTTPVKKEEKKQKKHIEWNSVNIREYQSNIAPTSVPLRGGVPVGLGWDIIKEETYKIEDYEELKHNNPDHLDNKRYEKEGSLSAIERQWILQRIGVSKAEINLTLQDVYIIIFINYYYII